MIPERAQVILDFWFKETPSEMHFKKDENFDQKIKDNFLKDYELASCLINSNNGVQCIITNSRHCSFGYDQRVELFGSKGMLISGNKKQNETELHTKSNTYQQKPLLNFFIDRY